MVSQHVGILLYAVINGFFLHCEYLLLSAFSALWKQTELVLNCMADFQRTPHCFLYLFYGRAPKHFSIDCSEWKKFLKNLHVKYLSFRECLYSNSKSFPRSPYFSWIVLLISLKHFFPNIASGWRSRCRSKFAWRRWSDSVTFCCVKRSFVMCTLAVESRC